MLSLRCTALAVLCVFAHSASLGLSNGRQEALGQAGRAEQQRAVLALARARVEAEAAARAAGHWNAAMRCNESPICCEQPFDECCEECGEVGLGGPPDDMGAAGKRTGRVVPGRRAGEGA